jgi:hypothetical protein
MADEETPTPPEPPVEEEPEPETPEQRIAELERQIEDLEVEADESAARYRRLLDRHDEIVRLCEEQRQFLITTWRTTRVRRWKED